MANFSFLALASVLASSVNAANSGAVGRRNDRRTIKLGNRKLRRGDPATDALLRKARPYRQRNAGQDPTPRRPHRRLDGEDFEIDGSYNLKFSQCVDLKTYDEDLFDEDLVDYVQAGQVVSTASYVLFHVCQGDDCYYEAEDDLYVIDLATYLTNVATYHANKRNDYCEQCEDFDDYCNAEEDEEDEEDEDEDEDEDGDGDGDEDEEEEDADEEEDGDEDDGDADGDEEEDEDGDGGEEEEDADEGGDEDEDADENEDADEDEERKLKKKDRQPKNQGRKLTKKERKRITRQLADKQYIDCEQCNTYECFVDYDEMDDGVQRRDELDEEVSEWIEDLADCKESGVQWNDLDLYLGAMCSPYGDGVELAVFVNEDCTMYTNQKSFYEVYDPDNDNDNDDGNGLNYLTYAEEFIKNAFSEVTSCLQQEYDDPDEDDDGNANDDGEQEYEVNDYCQQVMEGDVVDFNNCAADEDQEEEENDDAYAWYAYDMKEADDIDEVCVTLNDMAGEYSHVYDEEASGTWYSRNKNGQISSEDETEGIDLTPGIIAAIVIVGVIVVAGAAFLLKPKRKPSDSNEPVYQGGTML